MGEIIKIEEYLPRIRMGCKYLLDSDVEKILLDLELSLKEEHLAFLQRDFDRESLQEAYRLEGLSSKERKLKTSLILEELDKCMAAAKISENIPAIFLYTYTFKRVESFTTPKQY